MANTLSTSNLFHLVHTFTTDCYNTNSSIMLPCTPKSPKWSLLTLPTNFYLTNALCTVFSISVLLSGSEKKFHTHKNIYFNLNSLESIQKYIDWVTAHILWFTFLLFHHAQYSCYCYLKLPNFANTYSATRYVCLLFIFIINWMAL